MKQTLGIDTSSTELSIGLYGNGVPAVGMTRYVRNSHAEHIDAVMKYVLDSNNLRASDIERVAIAVGPGSFTGLRIGIGYMKGLFFGREVSVLEVSSLECIAASWPGEAPLISVALDARKGNVFRALFRNNPGGLERIGDDELVPLEQFRSELTPDTTVLTDALGFARSTAFADLHSLSVHYAVENHPISRGLTLARIGERTDESDPRWTTPREVLPRYLQPSAAERMRIDTMEQGRQ